MRCGIISQHLLLVTVLLLQEDFRVMPMPSRAVKNPDHVWLPWIMSGIVIQANLPNIDSVKMSLETLSLVLSGYGTQPYITLLNI